MRQLILAVSLAADRLRATYKHERPTTGNYYSEQFDSYSFCSIDLTCKKTNCVQYASLHFSNIRRDGLLGTISGHQQTVRPPGRGVMAARLFTATIICGLMFTTVTSVTGCGGNLTATSGGPVTSPNYPGNYGNNENCEWSITVPEGSIIRLTFDSFDTEKRYDFLTIYDGASDNAAEMERLTGYQPQISPIISTSNTLFLRFTSDGSVSRQGFQFNYISSTAGQCWDPGVPTNGSRDNNSNFTSGQTVRYTCMDGYPLRGTANITCQPNGTWSGAAPTCGGNK
ncbi:hypothetical protein Bbelb_038390 [Branchiostoma belcheri]|nr:hypothetical protein Bbelb_038390 [Branchiostoma belcheri]